jgi:hypothetical protein
MNYKNIGKVATVKNYCLNLFTPYLVIHMGYHRNSDLRDEIEIKRVCIEDHYCNLHNFLKGGGTKNEGLGYVKHFNFNL